MSSSGVGRSDICLLQQSADAKEWVAQVLKERVSQPESSSAFHPQARELRSIMSWYFQHQSATTVLTQLLTTSSPGDSTEGILIWLLRKTPTAATDSCANNNTWNENWLIWRGHKERCDLVNRLKPNPTNREMEPNSRTIPHTSS